MKRIGSSQCRWSRRQFLGAWGVAWLAKTNIWPAIAASHPLASFDREVENFMQARGVPGGALAVVKDFKLVYARGYGWADRERKIPVQPTSLFRLASLSKPITAVAILRLVQQGKLKLTDLVFDLLRITPLPGQKSDARLKQITIRHLLQHTAGWDRGQSGDPMFMADQIAQAAGVSRPPDPPVILRYMMGRPLDFDPGTRYAYSNFGYCVLGRVIEQITGQGYEALVKKEVLGPAGIKQMRIGSSLPDKVAPGEVHYYTIGNRKGPSVFAEARDPVPLPDGTFCLESMDAHGGWIGSAVDLMRFVVALEDQRYGPLLPASLFKEMITPPPAPLARKADGAIAGVFYGCGWQVRRVNASGGVNLWHTGSLPGTFTLMVRLANGLSWAVLFNQRQASAKRPDDAIDAALHRAAAAVKEWPAKDLFVNNS